MDDDLKELSKLWGTSVDSFVFDPRRQVCEVTFRALIEGRATTHHLIGTQVSELKFAHAFRGPISDLEASEVFLQREGPLRRLFIDFLPTDAGIELVAAEFRLDGELLQLDE